MKKLLVPLLLSLATTACVQKPTMKLNHATLQGVQFQWTIPPQLGVVMTVYLDVYNPNSYDVAVRRVRGTTLLNNHYSLPVDFQAPGDGLWLPADRTTTVMVPITIPGPMGIAIVTEALNTPMIPYRFTGKADVTGFRSLNIEVDDYSVDESGAFPREEIARAVGFPIAPMR